MRRKQKNKKIIVIAIVLLLLISVGYAALSTTLTINGTAKIAATSWNVHFANVQVKEGSVAVNEGTTAPSVAEGNTTTTSLTYAVTLKKPGDFYEFNVDVVNSGSIDAMVATETASIVTSSLTEDQQKYLDYTIKYVNGAEIEKNDKLAAGETKTITVKLLFKKDVNPEELPAEEQTGITLTYTTNYIQADSTAVDKVTTVASTYAVGDEVTVGGESFYIIGANESTVTLLAKYSLNYEGTAQAPDASNCAFSSTNYWAEAHANYTDWSTKKLDLNTVPGYSNGDAIDKAKKYATAKGGTNGRLLTYEEAEALKTSHPDMIYGTADYYLGYWLSSAREDRDNVVLVVERR